MEEDEALPPPPPRAGERETREERAERLRREEIRCAAHLTWTSGLGSLHGAATEAWHLPVMGCTGS